MDKDNKNEGIATRLQYDPNKIVIKNNNKDKNMYRMVYDSKPKYPKYTVLVMLIILAVIVLIFLVFELPMIRGL